MEEKSIFVIGSWPNNKEKIKCLINKIKFLKERNFPVCLVAHYPVSDEVQNLCDYYIYDKRNVLSKNWRLNFWKIINGVRKDRIATVDYHGVACLMNIRNAIDLFHTNREYKTIHYIESDLDYDFDKYIEHYNNSKDKFAMFIHYQDGKYRTDIFSCDIDWYYSTIPRVNSWDEYKNVALTDNYILEYWFTAFVHKCTELNNITFIENFDVSNKWTQVQHVDWDDDNIKYDLDFSDAPEIFNLSTFRKPCFTKALELLHSKKNPTIVEVGITRNPGCISDGDSTSIWAWYISKYGGSYHGCDINKDNLITCAGALRRYITGSDKSTAVSLIEKDGLEFLKTSDHKNIDLLYLDTIDFVKGDHKSGIYHLELLLAAIDKISIGGYVMFDDTFNVDTFEGKAELAIPYLLGSPNFTCVHRGYQFIFRRDC